MKIHTCYFCNYQTNKKSSLISHVTKQNKCNYLIYSIPINNIEDYYKLVELHKTDPDNIIWGENYFEKNIQFYNSDEESDNETVTNLEPNICKYCNNKFKRKYHLNRHLNGRCKVLKDLQEEHKKNQDSKNKYNETMKELEDKELVEQILLLKGLMDKQEQKSREQEINNIKIEKQIEHLKSLPYQNNTDNSITNITNNTQINNNQQIKNIKNEIIINNFGSENKDIFQDENYMLSWLDAPFNAIPHMIEKLHFCPKTRPENTNIRINNISNGKSQIYKNGKWKTVMKHELIYDLINECANKLIDTYELYVMEGKIERMARFEKFMRQYEQDDTYFVKSQTEKIDCKLVDLMKKHKTYLNGL